MIEQSSIIEAETTKDLAVSIIEQAVEDYKRLCELKIIVNGRLAKKWPRLNGSKIRYGADYSYPVQVNQLLYFFLGGRFETVLEIGSIELDAKKILRKLGILRPGETEISWHGCTKMN